MASSNIKLFDENKGNMLTDTEFNISTQRLNGLQTGVASSQLQNKAMYQASLVAYAIAQVMMQNGLNANDTDAVSAFVANLSGTMLQKVYDIATTEEAKAGVATGKWMSPALVKAWWDNMYASFTLPVDKITGTLPIAKGGTGMTANPSMLINLGSTSAASVFAASPQPGVTGTLPVARGGTGVTKNPSMLTNLGSNSAASVLAASPRPGVTGVLSIANGGTGSTTAAAAVVALGCLRVQTGSYNGTGAPGQNAVSLTFPFTPKLIFVFSGLPDASASSSNTTLAADKVGLIIQELNGYKFTSTGGGYGYEQFVLSLGTTTTWGMKHLSGVDQESNKIRISAAIFNTSGIKYYYVAFG